MGRSEFNLRSCADRLQIFLVALLLVLPGVGWLAGVNDHWELAEKRDEGGLARIAQDSWREIPSHFDEHFGQSFGFRPLLVRSGGRLQFLYDPDRAAIAIGKDGWLFLGREKELSERHCVSPPAPDRRAWLELTRTRREALAPSRTRFLWVLAPSKHTLYDAHFPDRVGPLPPCDLSSFGDSFRSAGEGSLIDLRPAFRALADERRLFHRTDSHWNEIGAVLGARLVGERLREYWPGLVPRGLDDFTYRRSWDEAGGNLSSLLSVFGKRFPEERWLATPRFSRRAHPLDGSPAPIPGEDGHRVKRLVLGTEDPSLPTAVVFHDSFGYRLIPHLAEHFRRVTFHHTTGPIDFSQLAADPPEIVIYISSEVKLLDPLPSDTGLRRFANSVSQSE